MKTKLKTKLVLKLREMQKKKEGGRGDKKTSGDVLELMSESTKRRNSVNMGLIHKDVE